MINGAVKCACIEEKQERIPVGCVSPTSVTTTRCHHWEGVCTFEGVYLPGDVSGLPIPTPGTDMGPGIPTLKGHGSRHSHPHKGHGTRHTQPPLWIGRH